MQTLTYLFDSFGYTQRFSVYPFHCNSSTWQKVQWFQKAREESVMCDVAVKLGDACSGNSDLNMKADSQAQTTSQLF